MSQQTTPYSSRSQKSLLVQSGLQREIEKIEATIQRFQKKIPDLEAAKIRVTKLIVVQDQHGMQFQLDNILTEIANAHGVIKACEEERERTREAIRKLDPDPAAVQTRLGQQRQLAQLANDRLEKQRKAGELVKELRQVLHECTELTAEIGKAAMAVELAMPKDDLDTCIEKLSASLPEDLSAASERWHAWFLGKQNGKPYIVIDEHLLRPETLPHNGHFQFGDTIQLTPEEAGKLLRADRPATERRNVWTYASPSVMTVSDFEAVARAAKEKRVSEQSICFWMEVARDAIRKKEFEVERKMSPGAVQPLATFESTMKIEGRARERMLRDRQYEVGDIVEVTGKPAAWGLAESGAIGPP